MSRYPKGVNFMATNATTLTIFVNSDENRIYLYTGSENKANSYIAASYSSPHLDDAFFKEFSDLLRMYKQKFPRVPLTGVSLILSDYLFFTDMLTIPNLGKKAVNNSLNLVIDTLYKNKAELDYHTYPLAQTKQNAVHGLVGARKDLLAKFRDVCAKNGATVESITFSAAAMCNGAMAANPKLKTANCLLLDIRETYAQFAFLNKGRTLGAYRLPFGYSMLHTNKLAGEDLLFDYATAELLVLNAKEKAKAKQLTVLEEDDEAQSTDEQALPITEPILPDDDADDEPTEVRGGRKLPKFMLREIPDSAQGFMYENFRIFVKWALELIAANQKITALGEIDTVYVNMPAEYGFLFDMVNAEKKENGTVFAPMIVGTAAPKMLDLFGGFQANQTNIINNF